MALDPEFKTKWVGALRSGKYKQGKDALHLAANTYCCLGVGCHLLGVRPTEMHAEDQQWGLQWLRAVGLRESSAKALASRNDDGKSFAAIADHIEKRL